MTNLKQEEEANSFALELLIPRGMILECLEKYRNKYKNNEELIQKLSQTFKVSEIAMRTRLLNLGILTSI